MQIEEEIFYPAVRECGGSAPALERAVPEHDEMRRRIERVRSLDGQRDAQDDALKELVNGVIRHVADEETQLLPAAEKFLGAERLGELGGKLTQRRLELARPRAAPAKTALMAVGALVAGTVLVKALSGGHPAQRSQGRDARWA